MSSAYLRRRVVSFLHPTPVGARSRARNIRGDARFCALATIQLEVHVLYLRYRRLVRPFLASCSPRDGCQRSEELRVHVRVGKIARARKELLDVGLVRQVRGVLLEDRVVEREANESRTATGPFRRTRVSTVFR